ncbi:type II secretion system F family protein [Pectinatus brassicae]|uniref:Tight adherence protein C n=1 Tax=Pectinatus brassicae TaxID=862415 RepID=A0A840UFX2_9FIRM|nr:type II secretion system F family protein [Pectinatus brassicae]MBB5335080.1 tight adherence protein C [Pectinatus brassicae]
MQILLISIAFGVVLFCIIALLLLANTDKTKVHKRLKSFNIRVVDSEWKNRHKKIRSLPEEQSLYERVVLPIYKNIQETIFMFTPQSIEKLLTDRIMQAGKQYKWRVNTVAGFWLLSIIVVGSISSFFILKNINLLFIQKMVMIITAFVIGGFLPFMIFNIIIQRRYKEILRQLPEVLDLLCVSVQAGLSFNAALLRITDKMQGVFIEECKTILHDIKIGAPRNVALQSMAERCKIQEIQLFTTAVIQAERLGTSMGKILIEQADNMRERRMQRAKAEALKAPVKIIFPLVLFIFPAIFVITLLPSLLGFVAKMGK